jgi:hypothetical protein
MVGCTRVGPGQREYVRARAGLYSCCRGTLSRGIVLAPSLRPTRVNRSCDMREKSFLDEGRSLSSTVLPCI